ncbi:hypothetical protein [Kitasatospora sp. NPDC087314]|uniref:hypothetical protein n=1 Tax=Kitasatospora sp. NPDC087314 TaxID=3364068 RepID=UPI00381EDF7C
MSTPVPKLPVRHPMPGEDDLMARWMDDHGVPADWSEQATLDYAAAVAQLRVEGTDGAE